MLDKLTAVPDLDREGAAIVWAAGDALRTQHAVGHVAVAEQEGFDDWLAGQL